MSLKRRARQYKVRHVPNPDPIRIASPNDFVRGPAEISSKGADAAPPLPYCFDIWRRRSIYVKADTGRARAATFYYQYLREHAREIVSVPWEAGPLDKSSPTAQPILVFSPGRVGSTLLCSVFLEADIACVSEPDFYTQAAIQFWPAKLGLRRQLQRAVEAMTHDLTAALANNGLLIIKLRSQCGWAPQMLVGRDKPRTIFITRDFASWARSTIRAFNTDPSKAVARYLRSLRCHAWLSNNTRCELVWYDDLIAKNRASIAALERFIGRELPAVALDRALARDSQEDTSLGQDKPPRRSGWEEKLALSIALWNSDKIRRARADLPLGERI